MDFLSTVKGSMLENFYPAGWDMAKIDACCTNPPETIEERQPWWNKDFGLKAADNVSEFDMILGHEIAMEIKNCREEGRKLAMILPVGPMGMYKWAVFFLKEWNVKCDHVYGFNMDEWTDAEGNTLDSSSDGSFQHAMENAFYNPLGELTIPANQRNFETKDHLTKYPEKIDPLKAEAAKLVTVFGIGRMMHIAFWEPHFAAEFDSVEEWKKPCYRIAAKIHPLTVEQNAITSFKSRTTLVPCRANTVGPGLFLQSDKVIGGCDGTFSRGMQWQGLSLWTTLRYGPDMWIPSTFMPTLPGVIVYLKELAGPLTAECN